MDRQQRKTDLIQFLRTIQRPDSPIKEIDEGQRLVESGLIDSLAILQIVLHLERTYNIDFREKGIDPGDLQSVGGILDLIERETA
jgi:methoxymalonate biosynthesis acyl carrier protein